MGTDGHPEPAIRRVSGDDDSDRPEVPMRVLQGIEDLSEGRTVDEKDLEVILKF